MLWLPYISVCTIGKSDKSIQAFWYESNTGVLLTVNAKSTLLMSIRYTIHHNT